MNKEDLHVKGMMRNHCLAQALGNASLGELLRQFAYKAEIFDVDLNVVDRWFP